MMANAVATARANNDYIDDAKGIMTQEQAAAQLSSMNREKIEKVRAKKNTEFEHNLTNMLIHLYNGKNCNEFIKEYKVILDNVKSFTKFNS
jgi:predicted  nucleic acid-binding Zn-ribbon protein